MDRGWVRVLGAGCERLPRDLVHWNRSQGAPGLTLVGDDALGGAFGVTEDKDAAASAATDPDGLVPRAVRALRRLHKMWDWAKLYVYLMLDYDKVVFLDSDMLFLANADELAHLERLNLDVPIRFIRGAARRQDRRWQDLFDRLAAAVPGTKLV